MAKKEKEEKKKESPLPCVCGNPGVTVCYKGKKMVSCPNPERCELGARTRWHKLQCDAIDEWNAIIRGAKIREGLNGNVPTNYSRQAAGTE